MTGIGEACTRAWLTGPSSQALSAAHRRGARARHTKTKRNRGTQLRHTNEARERSRALLTNAAHERFSQTLLTSASNRCIQGLLTNAAHELLTNAAHERFSQTRRTNIARKRWTETLYTCRCVTHTALTQHILINSTAVIIREVHMYDTHTHMCTLTIIIQMHIRINSIQQPWPASAQLLVQAVINIYIFNKYFFLFWWFSE